MRRPRLLDLFCKAGGAAMGYYRAGFDIVGVDIEPQKRELSEGQCCKALGLDRVSFRELAAREQS